MIEPAHASDSAAQRTAEGYMLDILGASLGLTLTPRRLRAPGGEVIDVDGMAEDGSVVVECWAHQGPAKGAQRMKHLHDAVKLGWAASWLDPTPGRLILCVSDPEAKRHLDGTSWQAAAIAHLGVEIVVVEIPDEITAGVRDAQARQYR